MKNKGLVDGVLTKRIAGATVLVAVAFAVGGCMAPPAETRLTRGKIEYRDCLANGQVAGEDGRQTAYAFAVTTAKKAGKDLSVIFVRPSEEEPTPGALRDEAFAKARPTREFRFKNDEDKVNDQHNSVFVMKELGVGLTGDRCAQKIQEMVVSTECPKDTTLPCISFLTVNTFSKLDRNIDRREPLSVFKSIRKVHPRSVTPFLYGN